MPEKYAHTKENAPQTEWQTLAEHSEGVARLAEQFAELFSAKPWGYWLGMWHDLGKLSDEYQNYLMTVSDPDPHVAESAGKVDHSTAGAQYAGQHVKNLGHLLAYPIAGHHGGLPDGISEKSCLEKRLVKEIPEYHNKSQLPAPDLMKELPPFLRDALGKRNGFTASFFVRMLFSCLVDADFLDTEGFMSPDRAKSRPNWPDDILVKMAETLDTFVGKLDPPDTPVNRQRSLVRQACLDAALRPPGIFSLTVPTGGGKTLSSLAFALKHAAQHGLKRIIYVIPFTSIIEQNAEVFRNVFRPLAKQLDDDPVLEHHCNIDADKETVRSRLATENWDSPLVVTTSVQFYESLFGNRSSRCRKLHNIAKSVIILDEVQSLPVDYLEPCLAALRELTENYGSTVVLCTATQPALKKREGFDIGFDWQGDIIPEPQKLYESLKRVQVKNLGKRNDKELAQLLLEKDQVLCIVNTRNHALSLFEKLGDRDEHFHLSARICPEHRSELLRTVHQYLKAGKPCRVISTQLIEAGVDIDFPCVFRSLAGLDSIAQAAGRCNRNGIQSELGQAFVFQSEHTYSEKYFQETANCGSQVLALHDDPLSLEAIEHYFKLYYWEKSERWDSKNIIKEFLLDGRNKSFPFVFGFKTVARSFRLIEDTGKPVIVPWGKRGKELCDKLRYSPWDPSRKLLRQLQRFTVQIREKDWDLNVGHTIELVRDQYPVLVSPEVYYSERTGLNIEGDTSVLLNI